MDAHPPQPAPALELDALARRYGRRWALRGVSARVEPGEVVGLIGRNGSGKTTLLRIVATLVRPTRGDARVWGHDLRREREEVRTLVALLGHTTGLYEDLTAEENLRFAARMRGLDLPPPALRSMLARVGLAHEHDRRVRTFSAGMRRRLALGRLFLSPPRLLLLDEPYAAFDPEGVAMLERFVHELAEAGGAALIATHDVPRATRLVDRFIRLEAGRVVAPEAGPAEPPRARDQRGKVVSL
ncbi:MAG TPA: heme ABC exporter ATP-binding protein CcmA [Longimicrobiales bacterium]|nr:heme ABC exporter ATP-binding protein CcmA [Longimicrobiales bacterium]